MRNKNMTNKSKIKTRSLFGIKFRTMIGKKPLRFRFSTIVFDRGIEILILPAKFGFGMSVTENLKKWNAEEGAPKDILYVEKSL